MILTSLIPGMKEDCSLDFFLVLFPAYTVSQFFQIIWFVLLVLSSIVALGIGLMFQFLISILG